MMKKKYYLLFLCATGFAMASAKIEQDIFADLENPRNFDPKKAVQQDTVKDAFVDNDMFGNEKSVFEQKDEIRTPEDRETYIIAQQESMGNEKSMGNVSTKVIPTNQSGAMLEINGDDIKVNSEVLNDEICATILQLTEYLYLGTKRYAKDKRVYPDAFGDGPIKPPVFKFLTSSGVVIFAPIWGLDGGKEKAITGMIAFFVPKTENKDLIIWVCHKGSQGEDFEFLGGIGGASWGSNFDSDKASVVAETLGLDKKYGVLSFHEGYYKKIISMKQSLEENLNKLFTHFGIKKFSEFRSSKSEVTQQEVDNWRGRSVKVYIFGHSQGGGLTQVGAPYITTLIGRWLYGNSFDNKTFNVCHAICMSPARAIGDEHTMDVVQDVMGKGNIFGWCSPIDIIPCLPLGHNIDKRPIAKIRATIGLMILKAISVFLPKEWSELVSAISSTKFNYETLPIFAYVDYGEVLGRYCEEGIKVYREYLRIMKEKGAKVEEKQFQKKIDSWKQIKKQIPKIRKIVTSMQENYFKAHTSNIVVSKYYALKAVHYLRKLINKVPVEDLIGSQHWGASVLLQNKDSKRPVWYEMLFKESLIDSNIQKAIDRGIEYERWKSKIVPKSKPKGERNIESN